MQRRLFCVWIWGSLCLAQHWSIYMSSWRSCSNVSGLLCHVVPPHKLHSDGIGTCRGGQVISFRLATFNPRDISALNTCGVQTNGDYSYSIMFWWSKCLNPVSYNAYTTNLFCHWHCDEADRCLDYVPWQHLLPVKEVQHLCIIIIIMYMYYVALYCWCEIWRFPH